MSNINLIMMKKNIIYLYIKRLSDLSWDSTKYALYLSHQPRQPQTH